MTTVTTYIVVTTTSRIDEDARAAADAINRSAVEAEMASYTKFTGSLAIEAVDVEVDE
jgi:hypothetical protein